MIAVLGATGYIGQAFQRRLQQRGLEFQSISRRQIDYHCYQKLLDYLRNARPQFLINSILPLTISHACLTAGIPWGHVPSGCIYSSAIHAG